MTDRGGPASPAMTGITLGDNVPQQPGTAPARPWRSVWASGDRFTIEIIGPPASGKTTLAVALAARLKRSGHAVQLAISARPEEPTGTLRQKSRLGKLAEVLAQVVHRDPVTDALLQLMPIRGRLTALRRRRYIAHLGQIAATHGVLVQDQGYLCAIAGLAIDAQRSDSGTLDRAVNLVPLPDLVVRLCVPEAITAARLEQRHQRLGPGQRLLERGMADNRRLENVFDRLADLLAQRGRCVLRFPVRDHASLDTAVTEIVGAVPRAGTAPGPAAETGAILS